jgi:hypothetical protein
MYINTIHHTKINPKIPPTTLVLKYSMCNFSNFMMYIICHNYTTYVQIFNVFLVLKIIDYFRFEINQIYLKQNKKSKIWCPYNSQNQISKRACNPNNPKWEALIIITLWKKPVEINDLLGEDFFWWFFYPKFF